MQKLTFVLLLIVALASCKDDPIADKGTLNLTFKGDYDGSTLVLGESYEYPGISDLRFTKLNFYISDIKLLKGSEEVDVAEIAYLDFAESHNNAANAAQGEILVFKDIPHGDYTGIKFGVGLNPTQNNSDPTDYSSDNPLSNTSLYWTWKAEYIFSQVECQADTLGDDIADIFPLFHCGGNSMYQTITMNKDINIAIDGTTDFDLKLDAKKIFIQDSAFLNLRKDNRSESGPDVYWLAELVFENLANSISVE